MNLLRRTLLRGLATGSALAVLAVTGLLSPLRAWSTEDRLAAFKNKNLADAMAQMGAEHSVESADVIIKAPASAEDGAVVPIDAESHVPNTTRLLFFIDKNPFPLAAAFDFLPDALPEMGIRLRFAETSTIRVVAMANGQAYHATTEIKITAGGCGS